MYGRRLVLGCLFLLAVSLIPSVSPRATQAAQVDVCAPALEQYVVAPRDRIVAPESIERVDANGGRIDRPDGLLAAGGSATVIERVAGSNPAIVLDFGKVVSGQVTVVTGASNQPPMRIAASESLRFLSREGDVTWGEHRAYDWQPARTGDMYE